MNLSILHISDLHRDRNNPIRNDVLLDSLEIDCRHFSAEEDPKVRVPDLVVVSGDIIQGIQSDAPEPDKSLREQYDEALSFLAQLAMATARSVNCCAPKAGGSTTRRSSGSGAKNGYNERFNRCQLRALALGADERTAARQAENTRKLL